MPYQVHDISGKQLKIGFWFLTHKEKLKKLLTLVLLIFCVITLGHGIYGFINHFLEQGRLSRAISQISTQTVDFTSYHNRHRPEPLQFIEPTIIYTGGDRYDLIAQVTNPNEEWLVRELVYQFQSGDYLTSSTTIYLLPLQEHYLMSLANVSKKRLSQISLKVINIRWQRLKANLNLPKVDFTTSEVKFQVSDDQARSWASFFATNNTIYNFWEVDWQTLLYSGRKIVGINQVRMEQFLSGETREVIMSWFERLPRVSTVEVFPVVDLLNPDIVYQVPSEAGSLY